MTRSALIHILTMVQNSSENLGRDIMTFAGFCSSDDELRDYVFKAWLQIGSIARKTEILNAVRALTLAAA